MPLLGKIVVIKRNGTDGTEFPLTASCLFGRKLDCDIRIQLPQVSKEHCRIEFNENKELILTNLSSVNPTRINGEILQQSERLKHGDLITIIDRSFRFEYPPAPTPKKKRLSTPAKGETIKVLQDQQLKSTPGTIEKNKSDLATGLKDGSNLPICQDQSVTDHHDQASMDSTSSPFSDLYNMVKRDLATKPLWKPVSLSNTPLSRTSLDTQEVEMVSIENVKPVTSKSAQKKRGSSDVKPLDGGQTETQSSVKTAIPEVQREQTLCSEGGNTPVLQKKTPQMTPQKFTVDQVAQQMTFETASIKSPKSRRSNVSQTPEKETTTQNSLGSAEAEEPKEKQATRTSPRANKGKRFQVQKVLREVVATPTSDDPGNGQPSSKKHKCGDLPLPVAKRKRVSFGGQLSPELFDKRLPPDSPLRRGATPGRRSLGFTQKSHSLLRRASTIGLMGYQLEEDITESPAKNASPKQQASPAKKAARTPSPAKKAARTPSPAKKAARTPSPAKKAARTPSPAKKAARTPSPAKKAARTPSPAKKAARTPSTNSKSSILSKQSTPKSLKKLSVRSQLLSEESPLKTPIVRGRFSVSRIRTPSPVSEVEGHLTPAVKSKECATPRATPRRSSMKASARKTPRSLLNSALGAVRARRSGATHANLKVVGSWADIVKFGQTKLQKECCANRTANKKAVVKHTKVPQPKTPARRLKDHTSTGHADSPVSIVVGKAHLRSTGLVGAAPKVAYNAALFKKDMKMDEDLSGVSEIFKTPANSRLQSAFEKINECPADWTPIGDGEMTEISVINTPEEAGEMVVSPISVASTAKLGRYNSEAVTRLLQDEGLIERMDESIGLSSSELSTTVLSEAHAKSEKVPPVQTPTQCLTGVKRLLRTPRQKPNPIEDLRGGLLKTPKEPKLPQDENLEGVKELFNTPKEKTSSEHGLKKLLKTPTLVNSPTVCAASLRRLGQTPKDISKQQEDLTEVKQFMRTPRQIKQPVVEDLTGIQQLMRTPKPKKQPVVEDLTGIQQLMRTPKLKKPPVEDLVGVKSLLQTPKQKVEPIENDFGIDHLMKTPKQIIEEVAEEAVGLQVKTDSAEDMENGAEEAVGLQVETDKAEDVENDAEEAVGLPVETDSAEDMENGAEEAVALQVETDKAEDVENDAEEGVGLQVETKEEVISHVDNDASCTFDAVVTTAETEEELQNRLSSPEKKISSRVRFAQKSQTSQEHHMASDSSAAVSGTKEETVAESTKTVFSARRKKGKSSVEHLSKDVVQSLARKSTRGRNLKELVETLQSTTVSTDDEQLAIQHRRGRKKQVIKNSEVDPIVQVEVPMKSPVPIKVKRGRRAKHELENPQELEALVEGAEVASESAELQLSVETQAPVKTNTRARRGRPTTKEIKQNLDINSPDVLVVAVESTADNGDSHKSTIKTKRGRPIRKEILETSQVEEPSNLQPVSNLDWTTLMGRKVQSEVETEDLVDVEFKPRRGRATKKAVTVQVEETCEPTSASTVLPVKNPEVPLKSGHGRRVNPLKNQTAVDEATRSQPKPEALVFRSGRGARNKGSVNVQGTETVKTATLSKEMVKEALAKNIRGGQTFNKVKVHILDDTRVEKQDDQSTESDNVQMLAAPAAKSTRGTRAVAVHNEPEALVKRGRRATPVEVPPPVVRSSRGRKAAAKSEPDKVTTGVMEPNAETSNKTNVLESVSAETACPQVNSEVEDKRGRGAKNSKATVKDISVSEKEPESDKDSPAVKDDPTEFKQSDQSTRGPKGRRAKKREEPETEKPIAEKKIQPTRRERAATAVVPQMDVSVKRKIMDIASEERPATEPLTKRTRGKGASAEGHLVVAISAKRTRMAAKEPEETSLEEETSKKVEKLVRGRRKQTLPPADVPLPDVCTRRGTRGQKTAEPVVPSAPVRRTRRK